MAHDEHGGGGGVSSWQLIIGVIVLFVVGIWFYSSVKSSQTSGGKPLRNFLSVPHGNVSPPPAKPTQ